MGVIGYTRTCLCAPVCTRARSGSLASACVTPSRQDLSVRITRSDRGRASLKKKKKAAGSHHINSPKNVLIQSSLYFTLPRAIEKSYCR